MEREINVPFKVPTWMCVRTGCTGLHFGIIGIIPRDERWVFWQAPTHPPRCPQCGEPMKPAEEPKKPVEGEGEG